MAIFEHGSVSIEVDEDGFMQEPEKWNEEVAAALGSTEGVEDNYLRDYYLQFGVAPMIRKLCKQTGFQLKEIYELFPSGPAKGACKVAGLPKPTGCV
jgi:tRNA 2-thiouridine synthesizing protein E